MSAEREGSERESAVLAAAAKITRFGWPYRENAEAAARVVLDTALSHLDVVPRSEAEALAEALELIDWPSYCIRDGVTKRAAQEALAAYRAHHPKESA